MTSGFLVCCLRIEPQYTTTRFSPFMLHFGRQPKQPVDFQFFLPLYELVELSPIGYFSALRRTLDSIQEQAKKYLRNAQSAPKAYHDLRVTTKQFYIGDLILVYNPVTHGYPKFQQH